MKRIFTFIVVMILTVSVFAQAPQKMSYQAVIRNSSDQLVTNQSVGMKISILQGSASGTEVYKEIYNPNPETNSNGLVSIEIGSGIPLTGTFAGIDWSKNVFFIKTETDPSGSTNYTISGTSQILSVPYALHAGTAESLSGALNETDPTFTSWDKSSGIKVSISQVNDFQTSVTNNPAVLANTAKNSYPSADAAKLAAITGTNTGDQVITAMTHTNRTALDAVTGVNNGDQDLSTYATNADVEILKTQLELMNQISLDAGNRGTVADYEGNLYFTKKIGSQIWMIENLKTTKFNDGSDIVNAKWNSYPTYAWYNNDITYKDVYGALYNWHTVNTITNGGKNVCPLGWHVPSDAEWTILTTALGGESVAGGKMKEIGTVHWSESQPEVTNESDFTALPAGAYIAGGIQAFEGIGTSCWWLSTSESSNKEMWRRSLYSTTNSIIRMTYYKDCGYSIRCLKD